MIQSIQIFATLISLFAFASPYSYYFFLFATLWHEDTVLSLSIPIRILISLWLKRHERNMCRRSRLKCYQSQGAHRQSSRDRCRQHCSKCAITPERSRYVSSDVAVGCVAHTLHNHSCQKEVLLVGFAWPFVTLLALASKCVLNQSVLT